MGNSFWKPFPESFFINTIHGTRGKRIYLLCVNWLALTASTASKADRVRCLRRPRYMGCWEFSFFLSFFFYF
ncbi:hypothetical protein VTN02DRAFT_4655 [Thermoascus thermophilus]